MKNNKPYNFYNIVPDLISIDTNLKKIRGARLFLNMNFFCKTEIKNRFHYGIFLDNNINIPNDFDFKNEFYIKKDDAWFYRKKLWFFELKFKYDTNSKIFYVNRIYSLLPFSIGGILPISAHLTDMIIADLLLDKIFTFRGFALGFKNETICFIAPGFNGKTTFLSKVLNHNAKYITDDFTIIDSNSFEVYPTAATRAPWFLNRPVNGRLADLITHENAILEKRTISKLFLVQNSINPKYESPPKKIFDFWMLNSTFFLDSLLVKSYLFENRQYEKIIDFALGLNNLFKSSEYKAINNYNYYNLVKNYMTTTKNEKHWNNVGGEYAKTWEKNYARKTYSKKEMNFVLKYLSSQKRVNVLDIGIGSGRILENYINYFNTSGQKPNIFGVDIADSMVNFCKKKFLEEGRVSIARCDIASEDLPFEAKFDFISSIRVLKYNENWPEIVSKIYNKLEPGGTFVFTILNKNSMDHYVKYPVNVYKTTYKDLVNILNSSGFEIIEIRGLSKIKDFFYRDISNNLFFAKFVLFVEQLLDKIFGRRLFCREFFIACKK